MRRGLYFSSFYFINIRIILSYDSSYYTYSRRVIRRALILHIIQGNYYILSTVILVGIVELNFLLKLNSQIALRLKKGND